MSMDSPGRRWTMRPVRGFERVIAIGTASLGCLLLALQWAVNRMPWFCELVQRMAWPLGFDLWLDAEEQERLWTSRYSLAEGLVVAAMIVCAYVFARRHARLVWLIAGYAGLPLAATGLLAMWLRLSVGYWPPAFTSDWSVMLIAYAVGYLFAAPFVWEEIRKTTSIR